MNTLSTFAALSVFALSGQSFSQDFPVDQTDKKLNQLYLSPECGRVDYKVMNYGPGIGVDGLKVGKESLQLLFNDFGLHIDSRGSVSVDCFITAQIRVPKNMKFRAVSAEVTGTYSIAPQASGALKFSYDLQELSQRSNGALNFLQGQNDFSLTSEMADLQFTQCRDTDTVVTLRSNLSAMITSYERGFSDLIVDSLDGESAVRWDWNWQKCPESNQGLFEGSYIAARSTQSGRLEPAMVTIFGASGYFETQRGEGSLFDIVYSNDGLTAEGRWQLGSDRGTFSFELVDEIQGVFKGSYVNERTGFSGEWKGYQ